MFCLRVHVRGAALSTESEMMPPCTALHASGLPATTPTPPPAHAPHGPREPAGQPEPGTLPPQINDPDPADIPEIIDPESPRHPRLRAVAANTASCLGKQVA